MSHKPMAGKTPVRYDVTISSGTATSTAWAIGGGTLVGWFNPATLTNSTVTVQASNDGGTTWYDVDALTAISVAVSTVTKVAPADGVGLDYIRLKTPAGNEGGNRTFTLIGRDVS